MYALLKALSKSALCAAVGYSGTNYQ